jgi:hypothetical protein
MTEIDVTYVLCDGCALVAWAGGEFEIDDIRSRHHGDRGCDRCDAASATVYDVAFSVSLSR